MKAVVIAHPGKGLEAWRQVELPDPTPGPGQVLVRVRAASVNYRDLMMARGLYGGTSKTDLVPLSDGAGEVVALGPGVRRWRVGDRVAGAYFPAWLAGPTSDAATAEMLGAGAVDGMLAQYATLSEGGAVRVPAHLTYEEASTLPCAAVTAWNAIMESTTRAHPGGTVLVLGTGGVSVFAAQLALAAGLRVIGTTSRRDKIERLRALGVGDVIDSSALPEWQTEVLRLTGGEGVDQVIETGGAGTLGRSLAAVKAGGTVSLVGVLTGFGGTIDPLPVLGRRVRLQGVGVGSVEMFAAMNRALEARGIKPVVDRVFPFDRAIDALAALQSASHVGKLVVRVD
jgi:NADPH:quinone reductase-like Zn-dependent oxidoreductase